MAPLITALEEIEEDIEKEEGTLNKIAEKFSGMEEELEKIEEMHEKTGKEIEELRELTNSTLRECQQIRKKSGDVPEDLERRLRSVRKRAKRKLEESTEAEKDAREAKGLQQTNTLDLIADDQKSQARESAENERELTEKISEEGRELIQEYSRAAREVHQNLEKIEDMTSDIKDTLGDEASELTKLEEIEEREEEMSTFLYRNDKAVNKLMKEITGEN